MIIKNAVCAGLLSIAITSPLIGSASATEAGIPGLTQNIAQKMGWPEYCRYEVLPNERGTWARCYEPNGGSWHAIAVCRSPQGTEVHRDGNWVQDGESYARCRTDEGEWAVVAGVNTSPDKH